MLPGYLKHSTAAPQRRSSPVRSNGDPELLEQEAGAGDRIFANAGGNRTCHMVQNLHGPDIPSATILSNHRNEFHPLSLANCRRLKTKFSVAGICFCSRACLPAGQRKGLLPLRRRDGEIKGSRNPCEGGQVDICRVDMRPGLFLLISRLRLINMEVMRLQIIAFTERRENFCRTEAWKSADVPLLHTFACKS